MVPSCRYRRAAGRARAFGAARARGPSTPDAAPRCRAAARGGGSDGCVLWNCCNCPLGAGSQGVTLSRLRILPGQLPQPAASHRLYVLSSVLLRETNANHLAFFRHLRPHVPR